MINRQIDQIYIKDTVPIGATILETEKLSGPGFQDVSIQVREGEIVGLYGLIGAGRSEFVQSVFGRHPATGGRIVWRGQDVSIRSERQAMDLGIALSPESRSDQGLCLSLGVGLNINLPIFKLLSVGPLINLATRSRGRGQADPRCPDQDVVTRGAGVEPVRRKPAEGRDRQMAQSRRQALHLRRADGRRRCRHQGGNLSAARLAAQAGRRASSWSRPICRRSTSSPIRCTSSGPGRHRGDATDTRTHRTKRSSPRRSASRARGFQAA